MRLADLIQIVLFELGGDSRPVHRSRLIPIVEKRWRELGHEVRGDFGQVVSATIQEYSSDSAEWKKGTNLDAKEDLFVMHKEGLYSVRKPPDESTL
jgi:hypothetical protein